MIEDKESLLDKQSLKEDDPSSASEAFSSLLGEVGDNGKWQLKLIAKTGLCGTFTSWHNFGAVFLAATPNYWCQIPSLDIGRESTRLLQNYTSPWTRGKTGDFAPSKCNYYVQDYSAIHSFRDFLPPSKEQQRQLQDQTWTCSSWYYDTEEYGPTVVSEWDLVCGRKWLMSWVQASYMVGILLGAVLFSALSDRIGRRKASLVATFLFVISSIMAAFSPSLSTFLTLRLLTAASGQGLYLVNFVMTMECSGIKLRTKLPNYFSLYFCISSVFLPVAAYYLKNWRHLQLFCSLPTVILLLYLWILPESPRWLMMNGRTREGLKILREIASDNNRSLPPENRLKVYVETINEEIERKNFNTRSAPRFQNLKTLFATPNMRQRNLRICFCWFVVSMTTYGLFFNSSNIDMSKYKSVFIMSVVSAPMGFFLVCLLQRFGRRLTLSALFIIGGIFCLAVIFVPYEPALFLFLFTTTGKTLIGMAFGILFIYTTELVPTHVRNMALGVASMSGRLGSILSPFIVDFLGDVYYAIPAVVFGSLSLISGFLAIRLPETGFKGLPESVQEIESMPR